MSTDMTVAELALLLSRVPGLGPRGVYKTLTRTDSGPDVLACAVEDLRKCYGVSQSAAEFICENAPALREETRELAEKVAGLGIHVITVRDNLYPASLKAYQFHLPPVIYAYGNLNLLQERRFAIINSATITERGSAAARDIANLLIDEGLTLVTGHNNQPYQLMVLTAKKRGAPIVIVLDRGIISAFHGLLDWQPVTMARIWDPQFDPERDLVVSQFRLGDHWIGANSRLRDRMVFGLADVVIACEVRSGGVMEKECLFARERGRELLICSYGEDDPAGNRALRQVGCQPLNVSDAKSQLISLYIAPLFEGRTDDISDDGEPDD
ncbi:MAG: DNA-processing protein DprA [Armatimonadota bacterium]|nr:DNA-processing protein DprA [Armatimonadota bacterium]